MEYICDKASQLTDVTGYLPISSSYLMVICRDVKFVFFLKLELSL